MFIQPEAGVPVRVVVALDERRDEDPRVSQRPEPVGEHRGELEALEPALGIGVGKFSRSSTSTEVVIRGVLFCNRYVRRAKKRGKSY